MGLMFAKLVWWCRIHVGVVVCVAHMVPLCVCHPRYASRMTNRSVIVMAISTARMLFPRITWKSRTKP